MVSELRKNEVGSGLPPFIKARLEELGYKPSLRELARRVDKPSGPLSRNLNGQNEMSVGLAVKLAQVLETSVEELLKECPELLH